VDDDALMEQAITAARVARPRSSPNPWVGAALLGPDGALFLGATEPPGGRHAEIVALDAAGRAAQGATLATTLEPCAHHGRTGPCADALVDAGVARVLVGVEDPDSNVAGRGVERLRAAGIDVTVGVRAAQVADQLAPYLHHRRTGRPYVVLKLAATLDGRTAAPDGTSQWITGPAARADGHRLRAESDAIVVGAGTVRADDPALTVRHAPGRSPRRVVLGQAPEGARVHPCLEWSGPVGPLLERLGSEGVVQVLVEGGATVARRLLADDLVDRLVCYLAPAVFGGDDALGMFHGPGARTLGALRRGRLVEVHLLDGDLRVVVDLRNNPHKETP
jgi:diaminohydroxyphosphoribosylaminopyrimidine deaminase/5-amino-6-(5-phosphoribosylamino)uracil reductase